MKAWLAVPLIAYGCATQPPPQPQIVFATPPAQEIKLPPPAAPPLPVDPRIGLPPEVLEAIANPGHPTVRHDVATFYAYDRFKQYKLTFAPDYATQLWLDPDEHFEQATAGDTSRWAVTGMDHTVTIKMLGDTADVKMQTNITISTDKRTIQILARAGRYMPVVAWYDPGKFNEAMKAYEASIHDSKSPAPGNRVASSQPPSQRSSVGGIPHS